MTPTNVEKRKKQDDEGSHMQIDFKRQKIADVDRGAAILGSIKDKKQESANDHVAQESTIGANELASAFALASLASMSPIMKTSKENTNKSAATEYEYESRDADNDASSELGEHQQSAVPISPEVRSPIRSNIQTQQNRRVTFSNDTKVTRRFCCVCILLRIGDLTSGDIGTALC